jgi:hypothetical protein
MNSRTTILGLMSFVAFAALALAALHNDTMIWAGLMIALTWLALCTAALVAVYRRGAWTGFAIFGWGMFLTSQAYSGSIEETPSPTTYAVHWLLLASWSAIHPELSSLAGATGAGYEVSENSLRVALCLLTLAAGYLGAVLGRFLEERTRFREVACLRESDR